MNRFLRFGLIAVAVLVAIAAVAVALPFVIPMSAYRAEIEAAGTDATGRALKIDGPLRITLYPAPGIEAEDVSLANVPGGKAAHFTEARSVRVAVRLAPLLQGRIDIVSIALVAPQIHLEVDRDGEANWTLTRPYKGQKHAAHLPADLHIDTITVENGRITYDNDRNGIDRSLNSVQASFDMPAANRSVAAQGSFADQGVPFTFGAGLGDSRTLLAGEPTAGSVSLASSLVASKFSGHFSRDGDSDGDLSLNTPSLRALVAHFGHSLAPGGGLQQLSLRAHIVRRPHLVTLSDATLSLDGMNIKGNLSIATGTSMPALDGTLSVDHLDLNPYLGSPRRHQGPHEEGWGSRPIRLDMLKTANADLQLNVGSLDVRHLHTGPAQLNATLKDGYLTADLPHVGLYGGQGSASVTVDARGPVAAFTNKLSFEHVDAAPFLADTMGVDRILGTATLKLDVASRGNEADAIMRGLSGSGAISLANGQIHGINLGQVAHEVEALLHGSAVSDSALTSFSAMGGSFALRDGVLQTNDFHLANAVIQATGGGVVDLGNRSIDFRIVPRAVLQERDAGAPEDGPGGDTRLGVAVPVHAQGPWNHIKFSENFSNVVTGVLRNIENGRAPFKDLFGHTDHRDDGGKKHKTIGDVLKNMFGIH